MCGWRLSIAVTLGLLWFFTDCGRTLAHFFLGFVFLGFSTPLLSAYTGQESSTQTEEDPLQEPLDEHLRSDVTVANGRHPGGSLGCHYPHVKRSLQQVFHCVYARLVVPWYDVPEPCDRQPLHQVLSREFDGVIDRVIAHTRDFDVCQMVVGSIRILTQHLHNAKQSDRELMFSCRAEEMALLRELSDALVRNLLPEHLWCQELNRCALNEIVALKGLGLLVTWLSDPDNLNQLVVSQLDSVTPKGSMEELCASDPEQASLASQEEGECAEVNLEGVVSSGSRIKGKSKDIVLSNQTVCNKLKAGWSKFVDKVKTKKAKKKKMKKLEQELVMRLMAAQGDVSNEDEASSREGSVHSQHSSDREDSDLENYLTSVQEDMMEFKLSYEMWRVGCWAVSIPHAEWENEELIFTVHLEERGSPENLQWDIKKTYMEFIYFRNRWQDSTSLPSIFELDELEVSDEAKEKAKVSVEHFLQELILDNLIGHTQPVFQFLCPLDKLLNEEQHYGGVWGLLSGLAYFLTPGQEDEENSTETSKEISAPEASNPPLENSPGSTETSCVVSSLSVPTIVISPCQPLLEPPEEAEREKEPHSSLNSHSSSKSCSDDSENPLAHFKMLIKGLTRSRSQESLASVRNLGEENPDDDGQNGGLEGEGAEGPSWLHLSSRPARKEKGNPRLSSGCTKSKGKESGMEDDSPSARSQGTWEQLEATKAIFDLLKEISGNSILINIFDAILKPVMPILKKKVNSFLNKMNPTEAEMAAYISTMCDRLWPQNPPPAAPPPRSPEEKKETRERAHHLISARYSHYLVLKKNDMEVVFNLFQDAQKNKALVYMLLSFLSRQFFPQDHSLNVSSAVLQNVTNLMA
ncbi:uncharacterized protein [Nerophis lumbriciformis]|uniref:uncharacterized protein isoform X1 n=2 Tax=Nerophis lumbriciformis TaxID=546530 RepID=UPI002ADF2B2A|nr:uncharacterized protein si:rp71-46j2.7 isoform X1 [Nerophis lumbriciformis]